MNAFESNAPDTANTSTFPSFHEPPPRTAAFRPPQRPDSARRGGLKPALRPAFMAREQVRREQGALQAPPELLGAFGDRQPPAALRDAGARFKARWPFRKEPAARLALLALLALLFLLSPDLPAASTVNLGTLAPEGTSYHRALLEMREKWAKAPGGGVRLRIYAGGKLGGDAKMVSQMRLGAIDAGMLTSAGLAEIESAVTGLQGVPMMYRTLAELDYVTDKIKDTLEQRMEKQGFVALGWSDAGWVHFFSKAPIRTPDDVKKTKLFTWAGEPKLVEIWKSAGFNPVPLETADIVPMLDSGLINCAPMPPFVALGGQIYDRAPHMLQLNWAPLVGAIVIRKTVWDKIPAETRKVLAEAAAEAARSTKALGRAESEKAIAAMKEKNLKVTPVDAALEAQWRAEAERFYPRIRGSYVPADIFDQVQAHLKEYRATAKP